MANFNLTPEAVRDLEGIFDYTIDHWGVEQAHRYKGKLTKHVHNISNNQIKTRSFLKNTPEIKVSKCEYHYIFHLNRKNNKPLIIAILHEKMNTISQVKNRLD